MKRTFATLCAALVVATAGFAVSDAATTKTAAAKDPCSTKPSKFQRDQCEMMTYSAPGDEYFGRLKLSFLGINNTFHDEYIRAGAYTTDSGIINKVSFADEALEQWAKRYPRDPQLARSYFLAIRMYKKIYTRPAQQKAWAYMHILTAKFPTTYFGKLEKTDLARGFTEHWFANAQLCPTPLPSGAPLPQNTPVATATPSPKPGQPKVEIIDPPCVKPSPVPTEEPSASPSPVASHQP